MQQIVWVSNRRKSLKADQWEVILHTLFSGIGAAWSEFNSQPLVTTCTPCRRGSKRSAQNLWSPPWWKEGYAQVLHKWKMWFKCKQWKVPESPRQWHVMLPGATAKSEKWWENESILWDMSQQLLFSLLRGLLYALSLFRPLWQRRQWYCPYHFFP